MTETLQVVITGKDGVSRVFKDISQSADAAGKSIEQAGQKGEQGFRRVGDSAGKAKVSVSDLGAAATALGGLLAYAGNEALKQQQTIIGLESAFGAAADEMIRFSDELASVSIFNDDDIMRGERYFATLHNNYDLSIQQVQELMRVTADLASASGTTFEDASSRVTAAIRGEGEAAEYLGLTMNQQSIDRQNLTLTMSNQEAAQFRLNALYEQSGVYQGTAQKLAESEVGTRARLTNAIQDNAQALGNFIGPMGSMIAGTGFAVTGIGQMTGSLGKLVAVARGSSTAMSAMSLAMGPVGIGIGALVAGGALLINSWQDQKHAAEEYAAALRDLDMTQEMLRRRGDEGLANQSQRAEDLANTLKANIEQFSDFETYLAGVEQRLGHTIYVGSTEYDMYLTAWSSAMDQIGASAEDTSAVLAKFNEAISDPNINVDAYLDWAIGLMDAAGKTETAIDDAAAVQTILNTELSQFSIASGAAASSAQVYTDSLAMLAGGLNAVAASHERVNAVALQSIETVVGAINQGNRALEASQALQAGIEARSRSSIDATWSHALELQEMYVDNLQALQDVAGFGDPLSAWNLSGHATALSLLADAAGDAATGLDSIFRVIVGNTDAVGNQVASIQKWADELINVRGEYGKIDDLLIAGTITLEQYNAAQQAQETITTANAAIQEDLLTIQAKQAPLIADQTAALEAQYDAIAKMPVEQQLVTLGWMDSATAAQALELRTMGVAAAAGELGRNGEQAFATMVTGAANADPALKAILADMGLISIGADGTVTVNIPEESMSDMDRLTLSINTLSDLLDNGQLDGSIYLKVEGLEEVMQAKADVEALPTQKTVDVDVTLPGGSADITSFLNSVIGQSAPVKVPVELDLGSLGGGAGGMLSGVAGGAMQELRNGLNWAVGVSADTSQAEADIAALAGAVEATDVVITVSTPGALESIVSLGMVQVAADAVPDNVHMDVAALYWDTVVGDLGRVTTAAESIPSEVSVSVSTYGAELAIGNLTAVANAALAIPSDVSTTITTNLVTNVVTNRSGNRHGGIAGYAHGGVVAELAEAGPEILHFANGGVMPVFDRGLYDVPRGTYVSPNNAVSNSYGGVNVSVSVNVQGSVTAEHDLAASIADTLAPALESAFAQRRAGFGGLS